MKTPIEAKDVRKGDLIRKEFTNPDSFRVAIEYRASGDAHGIGGVGPHYLLDRPTPLVELPTDPTLGWMAVAEDGTGGPGNLLAVWRKRFGGNFDGGHLGIWSPEYVTTFRPAVAVPKDALDELRVHIGRISIHSVLTTGDLDAVRAFFAAIDEASA